MPPRTRRPIGPIKSKPSGPWKHGAIPVIGLVGGIGSGKSEAAARLAALGAFVIDADTVGHALLDQRPVREQVVEAFGANILEPAGSDEDLAARIDRRVLAAIVFKDAAALKTLEAILHPRMRHTFEKAIARVARQGQATAVVLDAAVLFEARWDGLCDHVLFLDAPRELRLARLKEQRGWDEGRLTEREAAQGPLDRKKERASLVVFNSGTTDELSVAIELALKALRPTPRAQPQRQSTPANPAAARHRPDRNRGR